MNDTEKKTILIVEDESALLRALVNKFTKEGFNVLEAKNGKEGMDVALKMHPDLLMLDIMMPNMDGMMMLKKIREDEWGKSVPAIFLTNVSDPEKIGRIIESGGYDLSGVYDYIVKTDWKLEDIVKRVKEKLSLEGASPSSGPDNRSI